MISFGFQLERAAEIHSFEDGQVIFEAGQRGETMYVILAGQVAITLGDQQIDLLEVGSLFGEMALVDEKPRSATATAVGATSLARIDQTAFAELVQQSPAFALDVMAIMSQRLRRMVENEAEYLRLEQELLLGREIQLSLLPGSCPEVPGWDMAAAYRAAQTIGGDLYDFVQDPDQPDQLYLVTADVTGKGIPAALFMASSRSILRSACFTGQGPAAVLGQANRITKLDTRAPLFLSAFISRLDIHSGRLEYANAGHELPLLIRAKSGDLETLEARGILLGAFPELDYEQHEIPLLAGDIVVYFTDGITEARNDAGDFYGLERLQALLRGQEWTTADQVLEAILNAVAEFVGDTPASDDLTVVVVRRREASPASQPE
ncbi:MAG: SpoIIE family protein phosphatase [Candidatus Promineifilaceae bacterium]|nr:SpoIIE family protein phosphatase [Candidatus Promineifilaceae bacterium]